MGKDNVYRNQYDPVVTMQNVPKLLGMELTRHGNGWQGPYYLDGSKHKYRREKLKVFISRGSIWVCEEGGRCISLPQWMIEFGKCADFKDAIKTIKGQPQTIVWNREFRERVNPKIQYVSPDILAGAREYPLDKCPLFRWMANMFGDDRVKKTWEKFNVTTDANGFAVYWYVDQQGRILFDKRIAYMDNGHRIKDYFPGRKYRVSDGFAGRCYFGACAVEPDRKVYVVESEKAVLLIDLMYGRQAVATGGKGNLRDIDKNMILLPDYDARDTWMNKGADIWPWWEHWGIDKIPEKSDIGDMIEWKMLHK